MRTLSNTNIRLISVAVFLLSWGVLLSSCNHMNTGKTQASTVVASNNSDIPQLFIRKGELATTEEWQKTIQAVGKINEKLALYPGDLKARLQLAEIFINEARVTGEHGYYYPAILTILDGVLANKPTDEDIRFRTLSLKSSVLLSLHQFEAARSLAQEAVQLRPYNAQIYGALVDANVELGDYKEAVAMATKMMDLRPDLLSYSRAAYLREIHGDPQGAIEAMKLAVSSGFPGNENTAWSRLTLGHTYENYGNLTDAEIEYKTALEERPGYSFAMAGLASIETKKGNLVQAEALLKKAIEIIPEVGFNIQLAQLYNSTGRPDLAKKTTQEVLDMMADDEAHGHRMDIEYAKVYLNLMHNYDAALQRALVEYKARPANIDVNKLLAQILYRKGNISEAEKHLALAMRTNSQDYELLMIAGLIQLKQGNRTLAIQIMQKSREYNPYQTNQFSSEAFDTLVATRN